MQAAITYAKKHMYSEAPAPYLSAPSDAVETHEESQLAKEPVWLSALDTLENIEKAIHDAVQRLEAADRTTPTTSSFPPISRHSRSASGVKRYMMRSPSFDLRPLCK